MAVKSIGEYSFPSRSRQELYGEDQLVHVWWRDNPWFCAAACFRAPKAMTWGDFWNGLVIPFMEEDPDFDPAHPFAWALEGESFTPDPAATLESLGVFHKSVISMSSAA